MKFIIGCVIGILLVNCSEGQEAKSAPSEIVIDEYSNQIDYYSKSFNKEIKLLEQSNKAISERLSEDIRPSIDMIFDSISAYIVDFEKNLAKENVELTFKNSQIQTSVILFGENISNPRTDLLSAYELKSKLNEFKKDANVLVPNYVDFDKLLNLDDVINDEVATPWEVNEFYYVPRKLVFLKLAKLKLDVLKIQNITLNYLASPPPHLAIFQISNSRRLHILDFKQL